MRLAIAGATGTVGTHVVEVARERGHDPLPLTRSSGVDLTVRDGLPAGRLLGVDAVIDTLSTPTMKRAAAVDFFTTTSRNLLAAAASAGVDHHVALSIVGIDRVGAGMAHYAGKLAQEAVVSAAPVPWSILRTTQFHEFAVQVLDFMAIGPWSLVPRMRVQPVAAREVAEALVGLAEAGPLGRAPELAGPQEHALVDLARRANAVRRMGRRVVPISVPGAAGRALRDGAVLPTGDGPRGRQTFEDWLTS